MTRLTSKPIPHPPTPIQLERQRKLRQFNWLFVYTPLIVCALIVLGLVSLLFWQAVWQQQEGSLIFASGMADLILILLMVPMALLGLLGPAALGGIIYFWYYSRQQAKEKGQAGNLIQRYSWRAEGLLDKAQAKVEPVASKSAHTVTRMNGWISYVSTWIEKIYTNFIRR